MGSGETKLEEIMDWLLNYINPFSSAVSLAMTVVAIAGWYYVRKKGSENVKAYCGPTWMPAWMRLSISYHFNDPCRVHDDCYKLGGSRAECDAQFKEHMKLAAGNNPLKRIVALLMIVAVKMFGWLAKKPRWMQ